MFHFDISGKDFKYEHPLKIWLIFSTFFVSHSEILGTSFNDKFFLKYLVKKNKLFLKLKYLLFKKESKSLIPNSFILSIKDNISLIFNIGVIENK